MAAKLIACSAATLLLAGCAGWNRQVDRSNPTAQRENRAAEAIRNFEEHRDRAQYQAALDRCRQGDAALAESQLAALLARRPDCGEARLRLAEILWSRGDASAEAHFRTVLAVEPNRAEAHHALGLLLDATNRPDEAQSHFTKAAELEPDNEVFRTTIVAARGNAIQ